MTHRQHFQLMGLLGFALLVLFPGLDVSELIDWDENIFAEASRQMVLRGDRILMISFGRVHMAA